MNTLFEDAHNRMVEMGFTQEELDFIFADWPEGEDHYKWLLTATREEIESWIEAGNE